MTKNADITFRDNHFFISGELDFSNVMSVYKKSLQLIRAHSPSSLIFNFSELKSSNSAGLGLIIEWIKISKKSQRSIQLVALSKSILAVIKAGRLDGFDLR